MLGDVVEAATSVGEVRVVTGDAAGRLVAGELGATAVDDPGEGQGAAVAAALEDVDGICLVVNADLPRVRPSDLAALAVPPRLGRVALVASADGRTNALGTAVRRDLPAALRARQRAPLPGARARARPGLRGARATEPRRRRRHARRPRRARAAWGRADARARGSDRAVKVVCLSGGVGGAKLARGLYDVLGSGLTVVGNVGDDLEVLGLHVSPDLDSVLYALAGLNDEERGWGRAGESWRALESAREWGGDAWFQLGDLDLGLHLVRAAALARGEPLSSVSAALARAAGVEAPLLPATDDELRTQRRDPRGHVLVPGVVRRAEARGRGRRRGLRRRRRGHARRPVSSRRSSRRTRSSSRPATRTSRSARSSPSPRSATRSRSAVSAASPSAP